MAEIQHFEVGRFGIIEGFWRSHGLNRKWAITRERRVVEQKFLQIWTQREKLGQESFGPNKTRLLSLTYTGICDLTQLHILEQSQGRIQIGGGDV